MNVISASRRTDIPGLYWPWFRQRLAAGYCHWVNPYHAGQVYRVSLAPADVAAIVFWTRYVGPLLADLDRLRDYAFYVLWTLNGYPRALEARGPSLRRAVAAIRALSARIGPERVVWRYDPIVLSSLTPAAYHHARFAALAAQLSGATTQVRVSFCDPYARTQRRFAALTQTQGVAFWTPTGDERAAILADLAALAREQGMTLRTCAEDSPAARPGACVDPALLAQLRPDLEWRARPTPSRPGCRCVAAVDIGAFDTCTFGCAYCYAATSAVTPPRRRREHDPQDSLLWRPPSLRGVDLETSGRTVPVPAASSCRPAVPRLQWE
jgi:hypothetical protein